MLERYTHSQALIQEAQHISSDFLKDYLQHLEVKGYSFRTIQAYLGAVIHCCRWQRQQKGIATFEFLDADIARRFITKHLPNCRCARSFPRDKKMVRAGLNRWIKVIGRPSMSTDAMSTTEQLVCAYDKYLVDVAGLSTSTRHTRRRCAREFLEWISSVGALQLDTLTSANVADYIDQRSVNVANATLGAIACATNSFLRYLAAFGIIAAKSTLYVPRPKVINTVLTSSTLTPEEVNRLLDAFDRSYPVGKRDYAMARCLCDLGLRTSDVAQLKLDAIDWHRSIITLRPGKSRRCRCLPMPNTVQDALIDYLRNARPSTAARAVFVHHRAPKDEAVLPSTVRQAIRRAFARAGFPASASQVHRLRHTTATRLLESGNSLKMIADILGHQSLDTTTRYTYVDRSLLSEVALPWPGRVKP